MKKSFLITCIFLSLLFNKGEVIFAQTVTIPDTNFASFLHTIIPSAISGNQLDTSSSVVKHLTNITAELHHISSLEGVQYFTSLTYLDCSYNNLTSLPTLPNSLQVLGCGTNSLTSLPILPNRLSCLNCTNCSLTVLPNLPNTLKQLSCGGNLLTSLPTLPNSLDTLNCSGNPLTNLPALPNSLQMLWCSYSQLTNLPALPNSLQYLLCNNNQLTSLPALPNSLLGLQCFSNKIVCFSPFTNTIKWLAIYNNSFTCLPNYISAMDAATLAYPLCNLDNPNGCPVSTDIPTAIIIPNIFTPNGDSINDTFFVKGANLTNFSCKIFDRWGGLLYQWTDINTGWNGKDKNGATSADGTYYYVITYTDNTGKIINKNGFFQLLR